MKTPSLHSAIFASARYLYYFAVRIDVCKKKM